MSGKDILEEAEFENQLTALGDDQLGLIKFVARQQFDTCKILIDHDKRIKSVEKQNKKLMGVIGSGGAILGTAITAVLDYFVRRTS